MALTNPTKLLRRSDKWYVGGGGMLIYAPPFPEYENIPGYWDTIHFGNLPIKNVLCISLLENGKELKLKLTRKEWFPNECINFYNASSKIRIELRRKCLPPDKLICQIDITNTTSRRKVIDLLLWTVRRTRGREGENYSNNIIVRDEKLTFEEIVCERTPKSKSIYVEIYSDYPLTSHQITPAHSSPIIPILQLTPFCVALRKVGELNNIAEAKNFIGSIIYGALHYKIIIGSGKRKTIISTVRVSEANGGSLTKKAPTEKSRAGNFPKRWEEFLDLIPQFECSNPFITKYYWYRWYGIWLNTIPGGITRNYPYPIVTEGIDYFRGVITYSLMCHLREVKWLKSPELGQGCVLTHIKHQTPAGHFAGHIYLSHVQDQLFYHTDWGGAVLEFIYHHPDANFENLIRVSLEKCLEYYLTQRDKEKSYLFDIWDQFETGQEFSSRYFLADKSFDTYGWDNLLRMKGVDVTFYTWRLVKLLAYLTRKRGQRRKAENFENIALRIQDAVRRYLWDGERRFFFDFEWSSKKRSSYFSAVGFYPSGDTIATKEMTEASIASLFDKEKFGTKYQTPTSPVDDPYFSDKAYWKGERANCPWNGRVWPMVNSHIAEVLAYASKIDKRYRKKLAEYIKAFIKMMFFDGDIQRPNCFEHYSPFTGEPSTYRGIDDYQHSWVVDLILKYVAGIRASEGKILIDPFPFDLNWLILRNAIIRGRRVTIIWNKRNDGRARQGFQIFIDGKREFFSKNLTGWEIEL